MSNETDHKIDHTLKVSTQDLVNQMQNYDLDLQSNHIYLFGREEYSNNGSEPGVEYLMSNRFIRNLNLCMRVNPNTPVLIHMKTCGGNWNEGMAIYDAIKSCPFPVTILNYTHARSMSSIIFQAANKRVMMPHSYFMLHEGTLSHSGNYRTVMSEIEREKLVKEQMMDIYEHVMKRDGKFSNKSRKFIRAWVEEQMQKKDDVFFQPKESIEMGLADCIFDYNWAKLTDYTEDEISRG